ncbi:MAG: hypothetical protein V7L11_29705 [Nostoc sp.]|uniref:hypothetical protein n=1 Tax=Nostoc sp. TaxID=1180 RepID=UPI002FF51104
MNHWRQLNVKAILELAFRLPRSQSPTGGMLVFGAAASRTRGRAVRLETRFEKGFSLS